MSRAVLLHMLTSRRLGGVVVRRSDSHAIVRCGECQIVVPLHTPNVAPGIWAEIQSTLTPCLGEGWWE